MKPCHVCGAVPLAAPPERSPEPPERSPELLAAIAQAHARAQELALPTLQGTPRQVDWANHVRVQAIERHGLNALRVILRQEDVAAWWIENRDRLRSGPGIEGVRKNADYEDFHDLVELLSALPALMPA